MSDFGSIFRQVFLGKRGNVADALFAVADAIRELASHSAEVSLQDCTCPPDTEVNIKTRLCMACGRPRR